MIKNKRKNLTLNIKPSLRRILDMDKEAILANYALIAHKASSLSSTQRAFLQQVLQSKLNHGVVNDDEVATAVTDLANAINTGTKEALENESRNSTN
jgi:hypothetical protein